MRACILGLNKKREDYLLEVGTNPELPHQRHNIFSIVSKPKPLHCGHVARAKLIYLILVMELV